MSFVVPPRRFKNDSVKQKITQDELLAVQIANDANISNARKMNARGEPLQMKPIDMATSTELLADSAKQESDARINLEKIFRPQEVPDIIAQIRTDPALDFVALNVNFPSIEAEIKRRFNPSLITPTFFVEFLRKYMSDLNAAAGMKMFSTEAGLVNSISEIKQLIPDKSMVQQILKAGIASNAVSSAAQKRIEKLIQTLPSRTDLDRYVSMNASQQGELINALSDLADQMPDVSEIERTVYLINNNLLTKKDLKDSLDNIANVEIPMYVPPPISKKEMEESFSDWAQTYDESDDDDAYDANPPGIIEKPRMIKLPVAEEMEEETEDIPVVKGRPVGYTNAFQTYEDYERANKDTDSFKNKLRDTLKNALGIAKGDRSGDNILSQQLGLGTAGWQYITTKMTAEQARRMRENGSKVIHFSEVQPTIEQILQGYFGLKSKSGGSLRKIAENSQKPEKIYHNRIRNKPVVKIGKGISVPDKPKYVEFGKYAIHLPNLEENDLFVLRYKSSLGVNPRIKPRPVSDVFRDFMVDLLENGKPNVRTYMQVPEEERKFFEEVSIGAGIWCSLNLKRTTTSIDEEENKRFELLKGEYLAGNNNPKVLKELRQLVVKMTNDGRIRRNQGLDLLMELSSA